MARTPRSVEGGGPSGPKGALHAVPEPTSRWRWSQGPWRRAGLAIAALPRLTGGPGCPDHCCPAQADRGPGCPGRGSERAGEPRVGRQREQPALTAPSPASAWPWVLILSGGRGRPLAWSRAVRDLHPRGLPSGVGAPWTRWGLLGRAEEMEPRPGHVKALSPSSTTTPRGAQERSFWNPMA